VISVAALAYYLSDFSSFWILAAAFFMFGFFGNAFWSMAMTSTTKYVDDPAKSGFATSMYSVATNIGVAFVPTYLGPFFLADTTGGIVIVTGALIAASILAPTLLVKRNNH
jgi:DHA1 family inner membrane transport protein